MRHGHYRDEIDWRFRAGGPRAEAWPRRLLRWLRGGR